MKVYELKRDDGGLYAFEIENIYIRPRKIAEILSVVDHVSNIDIRKPFSSSSDVHMEFKYCGEDFMVWEPYGDSSRYWIGPKKQHNIIDIISLVKAFETYQPPIIMKILGDLLTLKTLKRS